MKGILFLFGVSVLILGSAMLVTGSSKRSLSVNPFHFEGVIGYILGYIRGQSGSFVSNCDLNPTQLTDAYICLHEKVSNEKYFDTEDQKKAFMSLLNLMNTTAVCWSNVEDYQKECMADGKAIMVNTIIDDIADIGVTMDKTLLDCNAPSNIVDCVNLKKAQLKLFAKTLLTDPSVAEGFYDTGNSLKDCLKNNPVVEKCVLNAKI